MSEIDATELARARLEKRLLLKDDRFPLLDADIRVLIDALEKARGALEERQGLDVTEGICIDRVVRERDSAIADKDREIAAWKERAIQAADLLELRTEAKDCEIAALREALLDCKRYAEDHDDEWVPHRVDDALQGSPAPDPAEAMRAGNGEGR